MWVAGEREFAWGCSFAHRSRAIYGYLARESEREMLCKPELLLLQLFRRRFRF